MLGVDWPRPWQRPAAATLPRHTHLHRLRPHRPIYLRRRV